MLHHLIIINRNLSLLAQGMPMELLWVREYLSAVLLKGIHTTEGEALEERTMTDSTTLWTGLNRNTQFLGAQLGYS